MWVPAQQRWSTDLSDRTLNQAKAGGGDSEAWPNTGAFKAAGKCSLLILTTWQIKFYLTSSKNIFLS